MVPAAHADGKSRAAAEAAEYVLQRFGRQAVKEGSEALARRIERAAVAHGDEVFKAVRLVGPRGLHLIEEVGAHSRQVAKVLATYGEQAAVHVVSRPRALALFVKHGEDCALALCKHPGLAEGLIEHGGQPAVAALKSLGPQSGRRLAMLAEEGSAIAKLGHSPEMLGVLGKYGDPACEFIWRNKGALAISAVATTFIANPEPYLNGTKDLATLAATTAVQPLVQATGKAIEQAGPEIARHTNWTVIFLAVLGGSVALIAYRRRSAPWAPRRDGNSSPSNVVPSNPAETK
jgi:hypothetical protein